jgi:putative methionine-R-sulfoxide reductase with GAF domain
MAELRPNSSAVRAVVATLLQVHSEHLELQPFLERAVGQAHLLTAGDGAGIALVDGAFLVYRAGAGTARASVGSRIPVASGLSGHACRADRWVMCADVEASPLADQLAARRAGIRSAMIIPLHKDQAVVGVLSVVATQRGAFTAADWAIIEILAGAIESALARFGSNRALATTIAALPTSPSSGSPVGRRGALSLVSTSTSSSARPEPVAPCATAPRE